MTTKDKNKKTTRPKNKELVLPVPSMVVAALTGSSESMVRAVRRGEKTIKGKNAKKGKAIALADEMLEAGTAVLLQEVKKAISL